MDILLYMQNETAKIAILVAIATLIFLLMPVFLILYIRSYNRHKKNHFVEKQLMQETFSAEMLKAKVEVQDQTMQSIATDLHDNVGQLLSLTTLTLNSVNLNDTEKAAKKIENSLSLVNKSIKELRELAKLLHGEQLVSEGIGYAIEQEVNWLSKSGVFQLKVQNELTRLEHFSPDKDLIILRLMQEIINNIIKHAQATHIEINAYLENDKLFLNIAEDGVGFDYDNAKKNNTGMGLSSIRKRMEMINGKLMLNSTVGQGTSISLEIPYP
ncbi:Signal transduction histidine kinase [Pedobacter rhizosphaerae]|uniref:Oxygen sensor histidine kinase NreB n=2 Tax=Pedobacter rhizosphaerae TaxID=390241 RepID=A0A1H9LLA1_9SPHI|nr:Signal transduction histidine kinase [Pedobacter rhizosphaerae]